MPTYLLTWNPNKWEWKGFSSDRNKINTKGYLNDTWSCGLNKGIQPGDRVFLHRQGVEPRGIFASGNATSHYFPEKHWDADLAAEGKTTNYIRVRFDNLLDPDEQVIPRSELGRLGKMNWDAQ